MTPVMDCGQNFVIVVVLVGVWRVLWPDHLLMQFLTRPNADNVMGRCRHASQCDIGYLDRWNFLDINFATNHVPECMPDKANALLKGDHEACHARIGNG